MLYRRFPVAAAVVTLMMLLPGSAIASPSTAQGRFECPASEICLFDRYGGTGDRFTINILWQGGANLEPSGWDNRTTSIRNNEQRPLRLLDGKYHDCVILATIQPGEAKAILGVWADNKTDLVDWTDSSTICDPIE